MTKREQWLLDIARDLARYLDYKTFGSNDRILLARHLHEVLMEYDDVEPCHDQDRIEWLKRHEATV